MQQFNSRILQIKVLKKIFILILSKMVSNLFLNTLIFGDYIKIDNERFNICDDKNILKKKK